jgi:pimeloyl-ACP methyl ester carboxylesterase
LLLIHGGICADNLSALLKEPNLIERYRVVSYHRRGYGRSDRAPAGFSIAHYAAEARALMQTLGVSRAHVVGFSYGGVIGLQLVRDAADSVASLGLLEPALVSPSFWEFAASLRAMYDRGDKAGALCAFFREIYLGPDFRRIVERTLPAGAFEQALVDIDTLLQVELPALEKWTFTAEDAKRIRQPVVSVVGEESPPMFWENHARLKQWIPHAEQLTVPKANHGFPHINPSALADGLARFLHGRKL